jgi:hypothetical protein
MYLVSAGDIDWVHSSSRFRGSCQLGVIGWLVGGWGAGGSGEDERSVCAPTKGNL